MRIIPKTAKVKIQFFKNISLADIIIGLLGLIFEVLIFLSNWGILRFFVMAFVLCLFGGLFFPFDGQRAYMLFVNITRYLFSIKRYSLGFENAPSNVDNILSFKGVKDDYIVFSNYFAKVLEIEPREFRLLSTYKQNEIIDRDFGSVIKSIMGKTRASIVKIDKYLTFDEFVKDEEAKRDKLKKNFDAGSMSEQEFFARQRIIDDNIAVYGRLTNNERITKPCYYLVVYDSDKATLDEIMNNDIQSLANAGMQSHVLSKKELFVFLKHNYTDDFKEDDVNNLSDEELIKWAIPHDVRFTSKCAYIDGVETYNFTVKNYPLNVSNAWGYKLFNMDGTKVVMNLEPYEKVKAIKMIDRSLQELLSQSEVSFKASSVIDKETHINTLVELLARLQNDNEVLYKVSVHIMAYKSNADRKNVKKRLKSALIESGFEIVDNYYRQNMAFISSNLSMQDMLPEYARAIHSSSVSAVFPFVLSTMMERNGILIGEEKGYPVILDFFKRNNERVNSNMVIMGKSGSGKSYATKSMLTHLASENSKIFILDPEDEYTILAKNLGGSVVDVGTSAQGRINPFHIITSLEADESSNIVNNFSVHLQFLEEFFKVILVGISPEPLEYLNNLVVDLYKGKHITSKTDLAKLEPKDYPIFDDLYELVEKKLKSAKLDYDIVNLRIIKNFVSKFANEGRDSSLWNGISTLSVKENFAVFNFRSLLANKNNTIANAQMLLVLKWLDNEIIKNRDYNLKYKTDRKIIVAIDEAHVFIDEKYPIALDFMFNLAKRIRKYNGMQIVITQNIKDFVGSPDLIRKSSAIINACQYSFIFSLSPNDMDDLCTLYDKAGKINETEQDQIVGNERGNAFIITSPNARENIEIVTSNKITSMFDW